VAVKAVYIGRDALDFCRDGCRAIIDSSSSHLTVPSEALPIMQQKLAVTAVKGWLSERPLCEQAVGLPLTFVLADGNLTLDAKEYSALEGHSCIPQLHPWDVEERQSVGTRREGDRVVAAGVPLQTIVLGEPLLRKYYTIFEASAAPRVGFGVAANEVSESDEIILMQSPIRKVTQLWRGSVASTEAARGFCRGALRRLQKFLPVSAASSITASQAVTSKESVQWKSLALTGVHASAAQQTLELLTVRLDTPLWLALPEGGRALLDGSVKAKSSHGSDRLVEGEVAELARRAAEESSLLVPWSPEGGARFYQFEVPVLDDFHLITSSLAGQFENNDTITESELSILHFWQKLSGDLPREKGNKSCWLELAHLWHWSQQRGSGRVA
ncbi:unnamed protein product, partial [Cladocopium goreaui]